MGSRQTPEKEKNTRKQTMMAIEEMSELTKEICKTKRGKFDKEHIQEEMADVQIMLWQLGIIFGDPGEWINKKMERLEEMVQE
jgi:NTP pyrophosphatase (non-canonical NTP hydrolase)